MLLGAGFGLAWSRRGVSPRRLGCPHGGATRHWVPVGQDARGERAEVAEQGEERVPEQGWGTGRDNTRGHLRCGGGDTPLPPACRGQPSSSSTPPRERSQDEVTFPVELGHAVPPVQPRSIGQPTMEGAPHPARETPRGGRAVAPRAKGRRWRRDRGQGNGANQGLSTKRSRPSRPGGGCCRGPCPPTRHQTPMPWLKPGCPHTGGCGDPSMPPPWAQAELSGDKSQPRATRQGQPRRGHEDARTRSQHLCKCLSRAGASLPPHWLPGAPQGPPPSITLQGSAPLQNTPSTLWDKPRGHCAGAALGGFIPPLWGTSTHHTWGN